MRLLRQCLAFSAVAAGLSGCNGTEPLPSRNFGLIRIADAPLPAPSGAGRGRLVVGGSVTLSSTTEPTGTVRITHLTRDETSGVVDSFVAEGAFTRRGSRILWNPSPPGSPGVFEIQPDGRSLVETRRPCPINALCIELPPYTYNALVGD